MIISFILQSFWEDQVTLLQANARGTIKAGPALSFPHTTGLPQLLGSSTCFPSCQPRRSPWLMWLLTHFPSTTVIDPHWT